MQYVSAVGVVNHEGKLVGCVSSHDLQHMIVDPSKFRAMCHAIGDHDFKLLPTNRLFTCSATDTLATVISKLATEHVHRVFVVNGAQHPLGVISMRDVIARLVQEPSDSKLGEYFSARTSF